MQFGDCPYEGCRGSFWIPVPDDRPLPLALQDTCETCKRKVWHWISRADPKCYTEADFLEEFSLDDETKVFKSRKEP